MLLDACSYNKALIFIYVRKKKSQIRIGNNPMVGMTVSVAVAIEEAARAGKF